MAIRVFDEHTEGLVKICSIIGVSSSSSSSGSSSSSISNKSSVGGVRPTLLTVAAEECVRELAVVGQFDLLARFPQPYSEDLQRFVLSKF